MSDRYHSHHHQPPPSPAFPLSSSHVLFVGLVSLGALSWLAVKWGDRRSFVQKERRAARLEKELRNEEDQNSKSDASTKETAGTTINGKGRPATIRISAPSSTSAPRGTSPAGSTSATPNAGSTTFANNSSASSSTGNGRKKSKRIAASASTNAGHISSSSSSTYATGYLSPSNPPAPSSSKRFRTMAVQTDDVPPSSSSGDSNDFVAVSRKKKREPGIGSVSSDPASTPRSADSKLMRRVTSDEVALRRGLGLSVASGAGMIGGIGIGEEDDGVTPTNSMGPTQLAAVMSNRTRSMSRGRPFHRDQPTTDLGGWPSNSASSSAMAGTSGWDDASETEPDDSFSLSAGSPTLSPRLQPVRTRSQSAARSSLGSAQRMAKSGREVPGLGKRTQSQARSVKAGKDDAYWLLDPGSRSDQDWSAVEGKKETVGSPLVGSGGRTWSQAAALSSEGTTTEGKRRASMLSKAGGISLPGSSATTATNLASSDPFSPAPLAGSGSPSSPSPAQRHSFSKPTLQPLLTSPVPPSGASANGAVSPAGAGPIASPRSMSMPPPTHAHGYVLPPNAYYPPDPYGFQSGFGHPHHQPISPGTGLSHSLPLPAAAYQRFAPTPSPNNGTAATATFATPPLSRHSSAPNSPFLGPTAVNGVAGGMGQLHGMPPPPQRQYPSQHPHQQGNGGEPIQLFPQRGGRQSVGYFMPPQNGVGHGHGMVMLPHPHAAPAYAPHMAPGPSASPRPPPTPTSLASPPQPGKIGFYASGLAQQLAAAGAQVDDLAAMVSGTGSRPSSAGAGMGPKSELAKLKEENLMLKTRLKKAEAITERSGKELEIARWRLEMVEVERAEMDRENQFAISHFSERAERAESRLRALERSSSTTGPSVSTSEPSTSPPSSTPANGTAPPTPASVTAPPPPPAAAATEQAPLRDPATRSRADSQLSSTTGSESHDSAQHAGDHSVSTSGSGSASGNQRSPPVSLGALEATARTDESSSLPSSPLPSERFLPFPTVFPPPLFERGPPSFFKSPYRSKRKSKAGFGAFHPRARPDHSPYFNGPYFYAGHDEQTPRREEDEDEDDLIVYLESPAQARRRAGSTSGEEGDFQPAEWVGSLPTMSFELRRQEKKEKEAMEVMKQSVPPEEAKTEDGTATVAPPSSAAATVVGDGDSEGVVARMSEAGGE